MSDTRKPLRRRFLLVAALVITLLFLWMVRSFLVALLMAAIFSALAQPLQRRFARWFGDRPKPAAGTTLFVLFVAVGIPLSGFVGLVVAQAVGITEAARPWIEKQIATPDAWSKLVEQVPLLGQMLPAETNIAAKLGEFASAVGQFLANSLLDVTKGTANFFLQLFVMMYAMYFFLVDGGRILDRIIDLVPMDRDSAGTLVERFVSVTRAVLKGSLIVGVIQGLAAGLAFWVAGIDGWAFWTTIMIVLSVIPAIGSALIWIPAVIYLFAAGHTGTAIVLLIWCGAVVSSIDNFLRPMLVGRDTRMPDLLVLISTLGGIFLFGAIGFILGPIVAALFLSVVDLYGLEFAGENTFES